MTLFTKRKDGRAPAARVCDHCRDHTGSVYFEWLSPGASESGATERAADWWLCSRCSDALRRNDLSGS